MGRSRLLTSFVASLVTTVSFAVVPPEDSPLRRLEVRHPDLDYRNIYRPLAELRVDQSQRLGAELSRLGIDPSNAYYDRLTGRWGTLVLTQPLIPGPGVGNSLQWSDLGFQEPPGAGAFGEAAAQAFTSYLARNAAELRIDPAELTTPKVQVFGERVIQLHVGRQIDGIPVRGAFVSATINSGNLVLLSERKWGDLALETQPSLTGVAAEASLAEHLEGFVPSGFRKAPRLEILPVASWGISLREPEAGLRHRLAWVLTPIFEGDSVAAWEGLVDAHSGEILAFQDTAHYASRRVEGWIYPVSNDGDGPDGTLQPGFPMPFADLALDGDPVGFTTTGGNAPSGGAEGTISTVLSGRYLTMNDNCGAIDESAASGDLDLEGVDGTDCAVPPGHSPGDTNATRSAFYEINRIQEQARGYLPDNGWLNGALTANMNIDQNCNATWNGSVNFFTSGGGCSNTGELAGVFDHEWGHGMDNNDATGTISNPGEGIADIYAQNRLNTSCIGRNFRPGVLCGGYGDPCLECTGVRDTDWAKRASGQPHDVAWIDVNCGSGGGTPCGGSTHCEGAVYAEALWDFVHRDLMDGAPFDLDLNTALELGTRLTYFGSSNVGNWFQCVTDGTGGCNGDGGYLNYLAVDDDNGDLTDGTPHMSAIFAAFDRHDIACPTPTVQNSGCAGGPATAPTNVVATPINEGAHLTWDSVPGASEYWIYRTEGVHGCDFGKSLVGTTTSTELVETGLRNDFEVLYGVVAVGDSDACTSPMSACQAVSPVEGPGIGFDPSTPEWTGQTGDGDGFFDNCETGTLTFVVNNTGTGALTNVRIVEATISSHPEAEVLTDLPATIAANLPEGESAVAELQVLGGGFAFNDTLTLEVTVTSDELDPLTFPHIYSVTALESDLQAESSLTFSFEDGEDGWQLDSGIFDRTDAPPGGANGTAFYRASSDGVDLNCDRIRSPIVELTETSTLELYNQFDIEDFSGGFWWDRANVGVFDPLTGERTIVSPDGGRTYNASGSNPAPAPCASHVPPEAEGWAGPGPDWQASTWTADALGSPDLAGQLIQLDVAYGTDPAVTGDFGFLFDEVTLTDVNVQVPDAQSDVCAGAPVLSFDPSSLDFGDVDVGTTSPPQTAMLHNTGDTDATGVTFSGLPDAGFEADTSACSDTLPAGGSCAVSVTFTPAVPGPATATLHVDSDEGAGADLGLSGNGVGDGEGPIADIQCDPLDFEVPQGGSDSAMCNIGNPGDADLTWSIEEAEPIVVPEGAPYRYGLAEMPQFHAPMGYDRASGISRSRGEAPADRVVLPAPQEQAIGSFTEGFDDITTLPGAGWAMINNSEPEGPSSWFQGNETIFPSHEGAPDAYIAANFESTDDAGDISNWLLTPEVTIVNGTTACFWTRTSEQFEEFYDRLEVRMSVEGDSTDVGDTADSVGDFTDLLLSINPDLMPGEYPEEWTEFCVTVRERSRQPVTGRFAFRYWVTDSGPDGSNGDYIGIDTVSVTQPDDVPPMGCDNPVDVPWLTENPNSGTTPPGGSAPVDVSVDAAGLEIGEHEALLCFTTNDPNTPLVEVPVNLTVTEGGDPVADITPESFEFEVPAGGSDSDVLNVGNVGTGDLTWSIDEAEGVAQQGNLGDIVVFDDINFTVPPDFTGGSVQWSTGETCECDDAPFDFNMWASGGTLAFFWPEIDGIRGGGVSLDGGLTYAVLEPGATIGPDSEFVNLATTDAAANWRQSDGVDGYLGFEFVNPDTGETNFGYARITTTGTTGHPATVVGWAYNQVGDPITIPGDGGEGCDAPADVPWLSADPTSGTTTPGSSGPVDVAVDASGLDPGDYSALLCVNTNDPEAPLVEIPVDLTVIPDGGPPAIDVDPDSLESTLPEGGTETHELTISNLGGGTLDWEVTQDGAAGLRTARSFRQPSLLAGSHQPTRDEALAGVTKGHVARGTGDDLSRISVPAYTPTAADEAAGIDRSPSVGRSGDPWITGKARSELLQGGVLLVPNTGSDHIVALDPETGDVLDPNFISIENISGGAKPQALLHPDGQRVLISAQTQDVVHAYDLETGDYLGVFAPPGGADTAIMDNVRGMAFHPTTGNLLVTSDAGGNSDSVVEFDAEGNFLGLFIDSGAGGISSPWSLIFRDSDALLSNGIGDGIYSFGHDGTFIELWEGDSGNLTNFPEQITAIDNGNVLAATFSSPSGVWEFDSAGVLIDVFDPVTGLRGVFELANGNILVADSGGVHEINRDNELVETKIAGSSYMITPVQASDCALPTWVSVDPTSGSVPGGGSQVAEVTFDATGLDEGTHTGNLCLASNDPATPLVVVPLTLTVTPGQELACFEAKLSGDHEVPPVDTDHMGAGAFTYDFDTMELTWEVSHDIDLTEVVGAHIHVGAVGENGPIDIALDHTMNPIVGSATLTSEQEGNLTGELYYVNVHTNDFPGGEIRGQILPCEPEPGDGSLTTLFTSNNGFAGNTFDLEPLVPLEITGFDVNVVSDIDQTITIYWKEGTAEGFDSDPTAWTVLGSDVVTPAGQDQPTQVELGGLTLEPGNVYGFYVDLESYELGVSVLRYTDGPPTVFANDELSLTTLVGKAAPAFEGTTFPDRMWNGTVHYSFQQAQRVETGSVRLPTR